MNHQETHPTPSKTHGKTCIIIGASHAGVNAAFALRKEGWQGDIVLFDGDESLPYHRPPLSKGDLSAVSNGTPLKPEKSYTDDGITLRLGEMIKSIDRNARTVTPQESEPLHYDKLVLAVGASPIIPPIKGLNPSEVNPETSQLTKAVFTLRTINDVKRIKQRLGSAENKKVVVIGGGYIGLEVAASLNKMLANVTVLEREERILARVTTPTLSSFFTDLHTRHGVNIDVQKSVIAIEENNSTEPPNIENSALTVICDDGTRYGADIIIVGVGVRVNTALAESAGITIEDMPIEKGIPVDHTAKTTDEHIYAIGDCTYHHNPTYDRFIRLESVQNAVDQAKTAASAICGKAPHYNTIPWFWSDQYDVKLQIVGLFEGYDDIIVRKETDKEQAFSVWYFKGEKLLAVEAVNFAKAYVMGSKLIKDPSKQINKANLSNPNSEFKPASILMQ